jgi:SAM-dependent methyltransferase
VPIDHVTDPAIARARAYFEDFAHDYDEAARESGWMLNGRLAEALALAGVGSAPGPQGRTSDPPVVRALDLACGTGTTLTELERALPHASLVGVDIADAMVAIASDRVPGARCVRADLREFVETTDERFDVVTAIGGFEFTPDLPGLLASLRRIVRPGGHLVFTYEPVLDGWTPQSAPVETNLGSNGLELTTFRWEPGDVADALGGWIILSSQLLAAYRRDDVPTVYGWLHVRRP